MSHDHFKLILANDDLIKYYCCWSKISVYVINNSPVDFVQIISAHASYSSDNNEKSIKDEEKISP